MATAVFGIDYETAQRALQIAALACAVCAGSVVAAVVAYDLFGPLLRAFSRLWRRSRVECVAAAAVLGFVVAWGGSKGTISFPRTNADYELLKDAGSSVTNDAVEVVYTRHALLPDAADIQMWRRPVASTNDADWAEAFASTVGAWPSPQTWACEAATNWDWVVFTTWQPAPAVQTNGIIHVNWLLADGGDGAATNADGLAATPVKATVTTAGYAQGETGTVDFVTETLAPTYAKTVETMTEEEYWFRVYAPNTALRIDLNYNTEGDNSFGLVIWPPTAETVVTVDWGDGTTTVTNSGSTADYLLEHTYAERKEYVVVIGDTLARPIHFYRAWYVYRKRWPLAVKNFMRWGDSAKNLYESLLYCQNCVGMTPRWPEGAENVSQVYGNTKMTGPAWPWPKNHGPWDRETYSGCRTLTGTIPEWDDRWFSANYTYRGCTGLTGTIPKWGEKMTSANYTYRGCTGLTGTIPKWGEKMTSANSTYRGCTGLTGAWTTDPDELMPTNMEHDAYVVADASPELRALFYEDWGGTKKRPTTDE